MALQDDDLDDELETASNPGILARTATILVFIVLAIAAYLYLDSTSTPKDAAALPLITENHPPEKVKPDNPGGMDIPNQDASVYDHLDKGAAAEPEKLMPNAEAPVNVATTPPTTPANIPDALPSLPAAPPPAPTTTAAAAPLPTPPADDPALANIVQQAAATQADSATPTDAAAARLQLGAVSNQAAADAEWARVKAQYADELKGLDSHFSAVDLGAKGSFVRIQTDAMSEADAAARCQKLKLTGQACMVVKAAAN